MFVCLFKGGVAAWRFKTVFAEFPIASIQLQALEGISLEGGMNPVKDSQQYWPTFLP